MARLQHPNIAQIFEVGEHDGLPFFSLEFCPGGSLENKLRGTPLPPREAAALVETLARAVQAAHAKDVIHRDLKPANVLLAEDGTPKITDFGLARQLDDPSGQTQTGEVMGTPSYMAPEQAAGLTRQVGAAADVYALGAILYELLTGRPPFRAATVLETLEQVRGQEPVPVRQLQPKVPRDLETICLKCLQKDAHKRYAPAEALAADLRRFQAGRPIQARPVGQAERAWRWCRRNPVVAGLLTAVAATLLLGAGTATGLAVWALGERSRADQNAKTAHEREQDALARKAEAEDAKKRADDEAWRAEQEASSVYNNLGMVYLYDKQLDKAKEAHDKAIAIRQRLIENGKGTPELRRLLATSYQNLGNVHYQCHEPALAKEKYLKAVGILKELVTGHEGVLQYRINLGATTDNLGKLAWASGKYEEAIDWHGQTIATLEPVLGEQDNDVDALRLLSDARRARAAALDQLGRPKEAVAEWDRALVLATGPERILLRCVRAMCLARSGEHAHAVAEAEKLAKEPNPRDVVLYGLACVYAQSFSAVERDAKLTPPEKSKLAEQYARQALAWLVRADTARFFQNPVGLENLRKDKYLDPLRSRADFQKLARELEETAKPGRDKE
jgi:tetratricopeptide (TPR) repeat protein